MNLSAPLWDALLEIADELIPAEGEMPAGGAVLAEGDIETVTAELPDLPAQVERALAIVVEAPPGSRLAALAAADADGLAAVGELVAAVYFLDPEISRLVGYRRREAVPITIDPDLVALTRPVVELGFRSPVAENGLIDQVG